MAAPELDCVENENHKIKKLVNNVMEIDIEDEKHLDVLPEVINNPVETIHHLWRQSSEESKKNAKNWNCEASFKKYVTNHKNEIPFINNLLLSDLTEGTLVRWRCMVRDQFGIFYQQGTFVNEHGELLPACYQQIDTNLNSVGFNTENLATTNLCEGVSIPGERPWITSGPTEIEFPEKTFYLLFQGGECPKLCQIINVCGIYYKKNSHDGTEKAGEIDVICWEEAKSGHLEVPSYDNENNTELESFVNDMRPHVKLTRASIINFISICTGGNELLSEYLLCHLCSVINKRNGEVITGKMSVNIRSIPKRLGPKFLSRLAACFATLVPRVQVLSFDVESLHEKRWVPVKDNENDRLKRGVFQVAKSTNFVIDQTRLDEGQLQDTAVRNVADLDNLLRTQTINYDFQFYKKSYDTDVPVIIVSHQKSILKTDCVIDFSEISEEDLDIPVDIDDEDVDYFRQYIATAREYSNFIGMDEGLLEIVQDDFVEQRQNEKQVYEDTLHYRINIARLLALSHLDTHFGGERYQEMIQMEQRRNLTLVDEKAEV